MKNTLNTIKETAKKQTKNIALASALIATLGSCGNKTENSQTTSTDSIKTEQAIDSIKWNRITNNENLEKNNQATPTDEAALKEALQELEGLEALESETKETSQQTEREKRGIDKETRDEAIKTYNSDREDALHSLSCGDIYRQNKEFRQVVKKQIDSHFEFAKFLGKPPLPEYLEVLKKYKKFEK